MTEQITVFTCHTYIFSYYWLPLYFGLSIETVELFQPMKNMLVCIEWETRFAWTWMQTIQQWLYLEDAVDEFSIPNDGTSAVATLITMTLIVFALTTPDSLPTKRTGCSSVVHPNERFIETAHVRQLVFTRSVYILTIPHVLERSSSGFATKVFYTFRHWDHDACSMSALIPTVCYLNTWSGHIGIVVRSSLWLNISSLAT